MKTQTVQLTRKNGIVQLTVGKCYEGRNSKTGAISELYACSFLMENGYDVFRNVCSTGIVDIVGIKEGTIRLFDVKTITLNKTKAGLTAFSTRLSKDQLKLGVELLYVTHSGECGFTVDEILESVGGILKNASQSTQEQRQSTQG